MADERAFAESRRQSEISHAEFLRHIDVTMESLSQQLRLVGEHLTRIEEKLGHEAARIRAEMNERFAETHRLIASSHVEFDRRIR